jgi:hypothetical protein
VRKGLQLAAALLAALLIAIYTCDYAWLKLRAAYPRFGQAFGTIHMTRLYAIAIKGGKTEYELDAQQPEVTLPCVRSLLPHLGQNPCWYLQRQSQKPIPM